jgi:predicted enzyme related to lactoylglutathione lyase
MELSVQQDTSTYREFEIETRAPARAKRFYERVFGWRVFPTPRRGVFTVVAGPGEPTSLRLADVADLAGCLTRLELHGGRVVIPTITIRNLGWVAYVQDPDGNVLCLRQLR